MAGKDRVPRTLREHVARMAGYRCGYCRTPESIAGFRLSIEHIIPEAKGGKTIERSLWLACHACNEFKGVASTYGIPSPGNVSDCGIRDVRSGQITFHGVRTERRSRFDAVRSATIAGLQLNRPELVAARSLWVQVGWWPLRSDSPGWGREQGRS